MVVKKGFDGERDISFIGKFIDRVENEYLFFKRVSPRSEKVISMVLKFLIGLIVATAFFEVTNINKSGLWWVLNDGFNLSEAVVYDNISDFSNFSFNTSNFSFEKIDLELFSFLF